jgi:L-fuculose-phosphate aldolase
MLEISLRRSLIDTALAMNDCGLNHGTSGNLSVRRGDVMLITPSARPYDRCRPGDIVRVDLASGNAEGGKPSSEWPLHRDIYRSRPEARAVLHAHPPFCTTLACLERGIPSLHYMVAAAGGTSIRCAGYAVYGSSELSANVQAALQGRSACLMAHHGMVCFADTPAGALELAVEVENLARVYLLAQQSGEPNLLGDKEMAEVMEKFADYRGSSAMDAT